MAEKQNEFFHVDDDGFGEEAGKDRRDRGIGRRILNNPEWHALASRLLYDYAHRYREITSDAFRVFVQNRLPDPDHPNSWGALFNAAASAGWLRNTGRTKKTKRKKGQARRIMIWEWAAPRR